MRRVDPGDLRRLPPSRMLSVGPPDVFGILEEIPHDVALPTWLVLADLQLLGVSVPETDEGPLVRTSALALAVPTEAEFLQPLRVLDARLLEPADIRDDAAIASALAQLADAFEHRGWSEAATAVAATWLWIQPECYAANLRTGQLLGNAGRVADSETLLARAVIIARQAGEWQAYCEAGLRLGNIHRERGDLASSRRMLSKVLSRGRRHGLKQAVASAAHDLLVLEMEADRPGDAEAHAEEALAFYAPGEPRLGALGHDVARLYMRKEAFTDALHVLSRIHTGAMSPEERASVAASGCRAAAGAGDRERFEWYWAEAWRRSYENSVSDVRAKCLMELATAARELGDETRARLAAERALESARGREDHAVTTRAEAFVAGLDQKTPEPRPANRTPSDLARRLMRALEGPVRPLKPVGPAPKTVSRSRASGRSTSSPGDAALRPTRSPAGS